MVECPKCGKDNGWSLLVDLCESCKNRRAKVIFMSIFLGSVVLALAVMPLTHATFKYKVDKCKNLNSSPYQFNHDVQINAEYAENCYWYSNYEYAYLVSVGIPSILIVIGGLLMSFFISNLSKI